MELTQRNVATVFLDSLQERISIASLLSGAEITGIIASNDIPNFTVPDGAVLGTGFIGAAYVFDKNKVEANRQTVSDFFNQLQNLDALRKPEGAPITALALTIKNEYWGEPPDADFLVAMGTALGMLTLISEGTDTDWAVYHYNL